MLNKFSFNSIGIIRSPFREKFGIPRQPRLARVPAKIEISGDYARMEAFRDIESFSHIWVIFVFHESIQQNWKPTVRPPRLGGNQRVGVFASRSMFRPNPVGLSVVELKSVNKVEQGIEIEILGGDFLDGTPVLDIKPYLPYVDAIADASGGYAMDTPVKHKVQFTGDVEHSIKAHEADYPELRQVIEEVLQYDPRPAYQSTGEEQKNSYAMRIYDFDVKWQVVNSQFLVTELVYLG